MVDIRFLETITNGDKKKMRRYITMYLEISPGIIEQMRVALEEMNWERLKINAHSLKPQVDYMGIPDLKKCIVRIEEDLNNKKYTNLSKLYKEAFTLHAESKSYLEKHLVEI